MLSSLHIENIAVIMNADIDFKSGFTALTGETGAGKSIIVDSINLLLGGRSDRELIRSGAQGAVVSALFTDIPTDVMVKLKELGIRTDEDGSVVISRTIGEDGRSTVRINGSPANLSVLREVSSLLITIHGQNDSHSLSRSETHIEILDKYTHNEELLAKYSSIYTELVRVRSQIKALTQDESARVRECEMLKYQISDIDAYSLRDGEEDELLEKKSRLRHSERIIKQSSFAYRALRGNEKGNATYLLERTAQAIEQLSDVLPECAEYSGILRDCVSKIDDIAEQMFTLASDNDGDPTEQLNKIEDRLEEISKLKRKYGSSIGEILAFRDAAESRLYEIEDSSDSLEKLGADERRLTHEASEVANELHNARVTASHRLTAEITEALKFLDMPKVRFALRCDIRQNNGEYVFDSRGYDDAEFLISANAGMPLAPMSKIASGGELARIMLALKCVMTRLDGIPTVIFDEIDAGVSGKTARKIGIKLHDISAFTQVLCVTHSAQIASIADSHKLIEKRTDGEVTHTEVIELSGEARVDELARILGGINITDAQRMAARDMMRLDN